MSQPKLRRTQDSKILVSNNKKKEKISLSWEYMTTNSRHTFEYFQKFRDELNARKDLSDIVRYLNQSTWQEVLSVRKYQKFGAETLEPSDLKFSPNGYEFTVDQKVFVFRFGPGNDYRLIGVKGSDSNVLYVIGYDFNFKAYNHGS